MRTIWKFNLEIKDQQTVRMPQIYELLDVQIQNGNIVLWARVDPAIPLMDLPIFIYGTGNPCSGWTEYIGTVQLEQFVWHIFSTRKEGL